MKKYINEREGQIDFFNNFQINYIDNDVLIDNTDGIYNGNIFEFKTDIPDLNKVLFQAVKYLSRERIKGNSIPANILLIDLNKEECYLYKSQDYFDDIHKIYIGSASKNNEGFVAKKYEKKLCYSKDSDAIELQKILRKTDYMPIDIDENCIVGWAERYYREVKNAKKGDFIGDSKGKNNVTGEIRKPIHFKGLINPYLKETNEKFKYLMDKLNDKLSKQDLGAFYTPKPYCEMAATLVRKAIERVPKGNDYIILDRCAGTGNLEAVLTDEELTHCIMSTYEYYEYKVLIERFADKEVRAIIPPTEAHVQYANGNVSNADALSEEYINHPEIKKYINDKKCTIIMYENPPYQDSTAITTQNKNNNRTLGKARTEKYVSKEYKKDIIDKGSSRELSNLFIWSADKYYLRQPTDSYIVFSPVKYFKNVGLLKKKFIDGFAFNRQYFHASSSTISCVLWANEDDEKTESWTLKCYDLNKQVINEEEIKYDLVDIDRNITIKFCHNSFDKYKIKDNEKDDIENNVWCGKDGYEDGSRADCKTYYNDNIIAFLGVAGFPIEPVRLMLIRQKYFHHGMGYYIRKDNYLNHLPLFCAKSFPQRNWYDRDVYFTSSDKGWAFTKDKDLLKSCLIYCGLSAGNKCVSFHGSDGRYYRNELCFDDTNGKTVALTDLEKYDLNSDEKEMFKIWEQILSYATKTKNYKSELSYGLWQINNELNTFVKEENKNIIYDYPELNGAINSLKTKLKLYYDRYIVDKLFKYELLK